MKKEAVDNFVSNLHKLKHGHEVDFYKSSIDPMFEYICGALFRNIRDSEIWYDGTGDLALTNSENECLTFEGNMHVAQGQKKHWREKFKAIVHVSDSNQNIRVDVSCGEYEASGLIYTIFDHNPD